MIIEKYERASGRICKASWLAENNNYIFDAYVDAYTHDVFFIFRSKASILYSMR